ncbi:hypothetical protein AA14362_1905 [Acetobacter cerevisiae DSM 14362]|nr:hypothetical protein AA14362_1905 [Acetobacter cerevisiae DSM 14362]
MGTRFGRCVRQARPCWPRERAARKREPERDHLVISRQPAGFVPERPENTNAPCGDGPQGALL